MLVDQNINNIVVSNKNIYFRDVFLFIRQVKRIVVKRDVVNNFDKYLKKVVIN